MILLDTNVLGRMTDSADPRCGLTRRAITTLKDRHERLVIVPQNLYEFWAVATRRGGASPGGQNGLGMHCDQASQWLRFFVRRFTLLPDRAELPQRWHGPVLSKKIRGVRSHDARLVAAMETYAIERLLTFNADDFKCFPITLVDPTEI